MKISEINKSISNTIDDIKYTDKTKTFKVSNILTIDWEGFYQNHPRIHPMKQKESLNIYKFSQTT